MLETQAETVQMMDNTVGKIDQNVFYVLFPRY